MPNRPQYIAIWLGLTRVGLIVSLINTNLTGGSLAHAINIVAPRHVIVSAELADTFAAVLPKLTSTLQIWICGEAAHGFRCLDHALELETADPLSASEHRPPLITDRALYIYTSGTTGMPKAAERQPFSAHAMELIGLPA